MKMKKINITEIDGFRIGNAEDEKKGTGCTVVVCPEGAVGGVDVRGGRPATRETDMLRSESTAEPVNAVVISGGSAFGLEAASGVMRELAGKRIGSDVGGGMYMPIVCGASLFDLMVGSKTAFPDIAMGMDAAKNAFRGTFEGGNKGAGTGATVGKINGMGRAMKSGLGSYACSDGKLQLGAVVAVNACGDVYNTSGDIVAGMRSADGTEIYGTLNAYKDMLAGESDKKTPSSAPAVKKAKEEAVRKEAPAVKAASVKPAETEEPAPRKRHAGTKKKRDRNAPKGAFSLRNAVTTEAPSKEEIAEEEARRAEAQKPEPEVEKKHLTPAEALMLAAAKQDAERAARYGLNAKDKAEPELTEEEHTEKITGATAALKKAAEAKAAALRLKKDEELAEEVEAAKAEKEEKLTAAADKDHKPKHIRTHAGTEEKKTESFKRLSKTDRVAAEAAEALKIELEAEDEGSPDMVAVDREEAVAALKKELAAEGKIPSNAARRIAKRSAAKDRHVKKEDIIKAEPKAPEKKEEPKPVPAVKEEPKAAPVKKEEPKPVPVVKEEPKAAPVKKEEPKPVPAVKEEPKAAPVKKEEPKPAPAIKEEPKAASVTKEEPKPVHVVREEPKAAPVKKEEPKPVHVVREEPKAAPVKKEEPKPVPVVKEEPKAAPVKKEEPKPVPAVKEESKAVPEKKDEAKAAPEKEEAKSVVVKAEPVKTLRKKASKSEAKSVPKAEPEPKAVEDEPLYAGPLIEDPVVADYLDYDDGGEVFAGRRGRRSERYKDDTSFAADDAADSRSSEKDAAAEKGPAEEDRVVSDDRIIVKDENGGEDPYYYDSDDDMGYDIEFNTTIACLVTNAKLTNSQANMLASILHDAYARSIKPVHGTRDGDTIFVLALGKEEVNFDAFAALATDIMQHAVIDGAVSAEAAYGLPAARDMKE